MASEPVASAFQGLTLETRRLPKKGVSDSLRKWCKLGLICSEILYKSSRFAHPLNPLQDSSSLSSSPSELPASVVLLKVAIASPFSSKDIGHMPRPSRTPKRQQAQSTAVAHREFQKLVDSTAGGADGFDPSSRSSRRMWGRGGSRMTIREYMRRIVRKNWGISIWRNLMKLISKLVSNDARSMSKHLKEGKFSSGKAC